MASSEHGGLRRRPPHTLSPPQVRRAPPPLTPAGPAAVPRGYGRRPVSRARAWGTRGWVAGPGRGEGRCGLRPVQRRGRAEGEGWEGRGGSGCGSPAPGLLPGRRGGPSTPLGPGDRSGVCPSPVPGSGCPRRPSAVRCEPRVVRFCSVLLGAQF